jgi:sugar phosphate isomerase/epimerase
MFNVVREEDRLKTRRHFLSAAGVVAVGAAVGRIPGVVVGSEGPAQGSPSKDIQPMRIGIFTSTFKRPTLEAAFDAVRASGLDCVQLNMESAGVAAMPDEFAPALADRIRREATARGITIASVQGTFNMSHPDAEYRRAGLRRLQVMASRCQRLGTSIIGICIGTRDRQNMWRRHPDNDLPEAWRDMVGCVREAVVIAKQTGVTLALEPEVSNVVDSARKARRLLDEIGSPHLKVTMDGANLFHTGELPRMSEILDEAFALLGKDIILAHAKDIDHDGEAGHLAAGKGRLEYDRYLSLLHASGFRGPLLLHGLSESQVNGCVAFLREKIARLVHASSKASSD